MTTSASISTSGSIHVEPGSTTVTPGLHESLNDLVAELCSGCCEVGPGVHAFAHTGVRRTVHRRAPSVIRQVTHRVGQVELPLGVARVESREAAPEIVGAEDVDGRVDLSDLELGRSRVARLDDRRQPALLVAQDAAVATRLVGHEGEDGDGGLLPPVRRHELLGARPAVRSGASPARTRTSPRNPSSGGRAAAAASPVPRGSACTARRAPGGRVPSSSSLDSGEVTTTSGSGFTSSAAAITQSTRRRPSRGWRCFARRDFMRVPRPAAITTAARGGVTSGKS